MTAADLAALETLSERDRLEAEMAAVGPFFDAAYYARSLPNLPDTIDDLLEHFCAAGWRQLRKPNPDFDVWWYWANHLDPADDTLNPLVHYALVGQESGLTTRPASTAAGPGAVLPIDRPVRRATLFAGFDAEAVVDEAVLILLRELARFSDVFVLFDGYLPESELAKLREVAQEAWAIRHGAYDFGSYAMLAQELVGWERLEEYDEVLFVNDSAYLVRPLDAVFERMDSQACDWWGLQATKGIAMTRDVPENGFPDPIPLDTVRDELLDRFEESVTYDFLVGSYFLAFRRPVLDDPVFRKFVAGITAQRSKLLVIQKYEIGLTHLLIGHGHRFSTFAPNLYPFHPIFTHWAFHLIVEGFPFLKRFLLYRNHYDTPGISRWKERLLELVPDAPVEVLEENLLRTAPDDRLQRSFSIENDEDVRLHLPDWDMSPARFSRLDAAATQDMQQWAFIVDRATHLLPDNSRAIFEHVADDPAVTKVVLTRSRRLDLTGVNVVTFPVRSPEGRKALMSSGIVLVSERPQRVAEVRVKTERHHVIAVHRGLTFLKVNRTAAKPRTHPAVRPSHEGPLQMLHPSPTRVFDAVLASSAADQLAAVSANWTTRLTDAWRTGLPAHDFLIAESIPPDLQRQQERLLEELDGRKLVLFITTLRRTGGRAEPYSFDPAEVDGLVSVADAAGAVLGIREPLGDLERAYSRAFAGRALDVSPGRFPSVHAVLRATDVLLTDVDGAALDFTLTGRPAISFVHDLEDLDGRLLYDLEHLFPGPVCRDTTMLATALESALARPEVTAQYARVRDLLIEHTDGRNTARVVERLRALTPKGART